MIRHAAGPARPGVCSSQAALLLCRAEESKRYAALVEHLEQLWRHDKAQHGVAAAADATLPFVPLAKA